MSENQTMFSAEQESTRDMPPHFRPRPGEEPFEYEGPPAADPARADSMWRFWRGLPVLDPMRAVTLGEGATPLLDSRLFPGVRVLWKDEGRNPTGSHKDRALSVAASHAVELGARVMAVVSAGSTGLSTAAYAARAGLASVCLIARDAPLARVYPAQALGARLVAVDADIDTLIERLREHAGRDGVYVASTTRASNAHQAEGAKTIAYEIVAALGQAPDWMVVPVGGGGTIAAIWRGFRELARAGTIASLPRLAGVVPAAYDSLAVAFARRIRTWSEFAALAYRDDVPTVLTKLSHAHPPDGLEALAAIDASGGTVVALPDAAALDAVGRIGAHDGLYLEPSAAIAAPAIDRLLADRLIAPGDTVVALACGHGFRETSVLQAQRPGRIAHASLSELPRMLADGIGAGGADGSVPGWRSRRDSNPRPPD